MWLCPERTSWTPCASRTGNAFSRTRRWDDSTSESCEPFGEGGECTRAIFQRALLGEVTREPGDLRAVRIEILREGVERHEVHVAVVERVVVGTPRPQGEDGSTGAVDQGGCLWPSLARALE